MDEQSYLELLQQRLTHYFDLRTPPPPFLLAAELRAADEGYFLVPKLKTYSVQHNEYLYLQSFTQPLTPEAAQPYLDFCRARMQELQTTTEHMSSLFLLLLLCPNGVTEAARQQLTQLRLHKDYCFTLKGWSDLGVIIVDLARQSISYNKAAVKSVELFAFPDSSAR